MFAVSVSGNGIGGMDSRRSREMGASLLSHRDLRSRCGIFTFGLVFAIEGRFANPSFKGSGPFFVYRTVRNCETGRDVADD